MLRMYKYVTFSKKVPVGLPEPAKTSTPEENARMDAINMEIVETSQTPEIITSHQTRVKIVAVILR